MTPNMNMCSYNQISDNVATNLHASYSKNILKIPFTL